jgi:hypothetical protein
MDLLQNKNPLKIAWLHSVTTVASKARSRLPQTGLREMVNFHDLRLALHLFQYLHDALGEVAMRGCGLIVFN